MSHFALVPSLLLALPAMAEKLEVTKKAPKNQQGQFVSQEDAVAEQDEASEEKTADKKPDPAPKQPPDNSVPASLMRIGSGKYFSRYAFVLDKSTRTLSIWEQNNNKIEFVAAYPSDMGRKDGDKQVLGDLKTPEGIYFFQNEYEGSELNFNRYGIRAFTTNYPNYFDERQDKTGSGIWLHAIPESKSLWRGSRGCVVIRNKIMRQVTDYVALKKTPFIIQDDVEYVRKPQFQSQVKDWVGWLKRWRSAWASKNIDKYMSYYGADFRAKGMNRSQWREYKSSLNKRYQFINVKVQEPTIFVHEDRAVIRFVQSYQSDQLSDFGEKTLYLKKAQNASDYRIIGEKWEPIKKNLLAQKSESTAESSNSQEQAN